MSFWDEKEAKGLFQGLLPNKLRNSMKGSINIKNNDNKCFLWFHIRYLNQLKIHPDIVNYRDYQVIKCPVSKNDYSKIEQKSNICINVFC